MKKVLKITTIAALMLVMLLALTGCGEDKIVATKTTESENMDGSTVKYEEKAEISFKNDKVDKVKLTYTFDSEKSAEQYIAAYNAILEFAKAFQEEGEEEVKLPKFKQNGKNVTMELNTAEYEEFSESTDEEMTKEAIIKSLEEEGYTVKK